MTDDENTEPRSCRFLRDGRNPRPFSRVLSAATALVAASVLTLAACDAFKSDDDDRVEITLLVAYSETVADATGNVERYVSDALRETNQVYANSGIDIRLSLAHIMQVDYEHTERLQDLERLIRTDDGYLDDIHASRDEHEADIGVLLLDDRASTINGAILAEATTAFVIVFWETLGAPDYALAHEIGHLQGARHSPESDSRTEPFPYGHGFRNDSVKTVMSTGRLEVLPYFSSPNLTYDGVVLGDSSLRDAARVLRETAAYVSNFRGPETATDFVPTGTWPTTGLD